MDVIPKFIKIRFKGQSLIGVIGTRRIPITRWVGEVDKIPSTNPGAEPPRDARDSGSARSHSTHLETSSSDRPQMVTYMDPQTAPSYMSVTFTQRTLRIPNFTRAPHAQPSLSNTPKWDSNFGEPSVSDKIFQLPPKSKYQTYTLFDIRVNSNNIFPKDKMNVVITLVALPQRSQL